jgi:hypothetical protein
MSSKWPPCSHIDFSRKYIVDILVGSAFFSFKKKQDGRFVAILKTVFLC